MDAETNHIKQQLIRLIRAHWQRTTGRQYEVRLDALDISDLRELVRYHRDLDHEQQVAVNRARMMPWRRG